MSIVGCYAKGRSKFEIEVITYNSRKSDKYNKL